MAWYLTSWQCTTQSPGSVGHNALSLVPKTIKMDTELGYALIRKSNLPTDWERYVIEDVDTLKLGEDNGHALKIEARVHLTTGPGSTVHGGGIPGSRRDTRNGFHE